MRKKKKLPFRLWLRKNAVFLIVAAGAVAAIVGLSFLVNDITENRAYDRYMSEAREKILTGDYDGALSGLRKAAMVDATDDCLLLMAQCYEAQCNYDKAILALRSMSSQSSAVTAKIASVENSRNQAQNADLVTVAGESISVTSTTLALDNRGLDNSVINELTQVYALNTLSLSGNHLTDLSGLSVLGGLTSLNLSGNSISDLSPLTALTGLRTLYLDNNPVTDLSPLYYLQSLTSLSIKGIEITREELQALSAALPNCAINGAGVTENAQYIALGGITFEADVTELDLSYRGLTDISALSACSKLKNLNLSGNAISDISPLMDIPNLSVLNISGNSVSDLRPLMGLSSLRYLYASSNNISSTVSLGSNSALYELDLSGNPVSDFSGIRKLTNLITLDLSDTGLQPSAVQYFSGLNSLQSLNIENNPAMTAESVSELKYLIPLCSVRHSVQQNTVQLFGIAQDTGTTSIDCTGQGLQEISFLTSYSNLQSVRLAANSLTNISPFQYTESWRTMTYLDLSSNFISDITPLAGLTGLVTLNLSDNLITDITPLYGLTNLRELYLGGNPLTDLQIANLSAFLPYCTIVFR